MFISLIRRAVDDLKNFFVRLKAELLLPRPPFGLLSISLFLDSSDRRRRLHLEASMSNPGRWPKPIWFMVQVILAVRWKWFLARPQTDHAIGLCGDMIERSENIPRTELRRKTLDLAKRFCIPPVDILQFRIYRRPESALDYIFSNEVHGMHRIKNTARSAERDTARLQDKALFAQSAAEAGLPSVPTLMTIPENESADISALVKLETRGIFVKRRRGFRGIGAFGLREQAGSFSGKMLDGTQISSENEARAAIHMLLSKDDVLVQPFLASHRKLQCAVSSETSVVLRVITRRSQYQHYIIASFLRFPQQLTFGSKDLQKTILDDVVARVDQSSGRIHRNENSFLSLHSIGVMWEDRVFQALGKAPIVPFWNEIVHQSRLAQQEFNGLWAIGWDWIVTDDGPVLLEGNVFWDASHAQEVEGGLLNSALEKSV